MANRLPNPVRTPTTFWTKLAWQTAWLGAPGLCIAGGTDEILRNIVAERVLGLPGEPRVDKQLAFQEIPRGPKGA